MHACVYSLLCALIRIPCGWCLSVSRYNKLVTKMAHGVLGEFDLLKESIKDFCKQFELYCLVNNICGKEEAVQIQRRALFVTLLGQATFAKLKTLENSTAVSELTLDQIMEYLMGHYKPQTIKIAKRFKFFNQYQCDNESTANFIPELQQYAKMCNFDNYLETAMCDQFLCGLCTTDAV